jgi:hypothetical protein
MAVTGTDLSAAAPAVAGQEVSSAAGIKKLLRARKPARQLMNFTAKAGRRGKGLSSATAT